jgi:hypothetical protein
MNSRFSSLIKSKILGKTPFMALSFNEFPEMTPVQIDIAKMASPIPRSELSACRQRWLR